MKIKTLIINVIDLVELEDLLSKTFDSYYGVRKTNHISGLNSIFFDLKKRELTPTEEQALELSNKEGVSPLLDRKAANAALTILVNNQQLPEGYLLVENRE